MNSLLTTNFFVDKDNKQISVQREFVAPLHKVWAAWTESVYLDQWWAPPPCQAETLNMDFRPGGYWLYAIHMSGRQYKWARVDYLSITPKKVIKTENSICDESGNVLHEFPISQWETEFSTLGEITIVNISIHFTSLDDIEQLIAMGFQNGFLSALRDLESFLVQKLER